jgi:hypothetical protein
LTFVDYCSTLWENLRDEIQDPKDALHGSSEDEINETGMYPNPETFLIGHGSANKDLSAAHPPPVQIFRLWQTFLVNVDPLVKIFHAPTIQQMILDASGDLENISRNTEALMFAIYFLAVSSLQNEECETMFGETRLSLLSKYSHGVQQALINAKFLKSLNLATLQAFTLYLLGVRKSYHPHSLWVLTGVVMRIAQRLGLHRDAATHKVSPFDAEMRRRTWWQVVFLDGHASKLAGAGFPSWLKDSDTKLPLNISDSDLNPSMKEPPIEKEGATEMIFCCLRYDVADALRNAGVTTKDGVGSWHIPTGVDLIAEKDKAIDELEIRFEQKYVRYCDPSIPLHLLVMYVAKSVICTMRLMAHHPRQYPDKGASMPQKEKDMLFTESLKELEFDSLGHTIKSVQRYLWHIHVHFQLDAFIYLISELRHRTSGDLVERAWQQVQHAFEYRPEIISNTKNSLYVAVGNLTLKAWQKREETKGVQVPPPRFISLLRSQRRIPDPPKPTTEFRNEDPYAESNRTIGFTNSGLSEYNTYHNSTGQWANVNFGFNSYMPMAEITPVDWEYWQTLMDGDLPAYTGDVGQNWTPDSETGSYAP